ncbi:MAG: class I tRNA ligase family protein, partial [Terriglobia bacterium]
ATLGWPEQTPDLQCFYPNDLMIMGEDILFFWGARMIMMGLKLTGSVPFRKLYIHALVRDAERQKMSKTKGNVLDPLDVTEKYGTDAVRFALAISAAPGTDISFSVDKVESYRAFANKIWNAGRFILMNLQCLPETVREQLAQGLAPSLKIGFRPLAGPGGQISLADRWMFSRLRKVTQEIDQALEEFRFHEAAHTVYHFFWHEFCDWYLEWVKPEIVKPVEGNKLSPAWINLTRIFAAAIHLLHPFMPFITEELWHQLPRAAGTVSVSIAPFQLVTGDVSDPVAEREFESIRELVVAARNAKAEQNLQRERPSAQVASEDARLLDLLRRNQEVILRLAGLTALNFTMGHLAGAVSINGALDLRILHEVKRDTKAERQRLEREKIKIEQSLAQTRAQLENQEFVRRAPPEVVRNAEQRQSELSAQHDKLLESLDRLAGC